MNRKVELDEYGCEMTKEEAAEAEEIAQKCWEKVKDNLTGQKKKCGWPKGKPRKPAPETEAAEEAEQKNEQIAPAQTADPMDIKVPDAVRNACVSRIEELEKLMQDTDAKINELKALNMERESEYKVLTNYIFKKGK